MKGFWLRLCCAAFILIFCLLPSSLGFPCCLRPVAYGLVRRFHRQFQSEPRRDDIRVAPGEAPPLRGTRGLKKKREANLAAAGQCAAPGFGGELVGSDPHIKFLRNLQELRSASAAHRKGSNYSKTMQKFGLDKTTKTEVFCGLLTKPRNLLDYLCKHLL